MDYIPIFLSSDDNYAPFVATTMASICDNTKSFVDFYVLDGGINQENKAKICELKKQFHNFSIEFVPIDLSFLSDYKNEAKYVSVSTYNRALIPVLKPNLDKVLYSDVDVIFMGDIAEMYAEDIENFAIGAVKEEWCANIFDRKSLLHISDEHSYFYAGNLVINCKQWREKKLVEKLFNLEKCVHNELRLADMDLLNKYFDHNNYKQLPAKYCYLNEDYDYFKELNPKIIVRHFAGSIKPWQADFYIDVISKTPKPIKNTDSFWKYAKMTVFYDEILKIKKDFLNSNILYRRFNKMVGGRDDT